MNSKLAKLISKYVKIVEYKDLRANGTKSRPDYVIRQKMKKMNWIEKSEFIADMKERVAYYE